MGNNRIFPGTKKTSRSRQIKFGLYSFLLAVIMQLFFRYVGALGSTMIVGGKKLEGGAVVKLFLLLYLVAALWCILFIGIQKDTWMKVAAVAYFPSLIMILLRASRIYDVFVMMSIFLVILVITPLIVTFISFGTLGFTNPDRTGQRREFLGFFFQFGQPLCLPILTTIVVYVLLLSANYRGLSTMELNYGKLIEYSDQEKRILLNEYLEKNYKNVIYADRSEFKPAKEGELWQTNIEGLKNLRTDIYDSLSDKEKLNALKLIVDIEIYDLTGETDFVDLVSADIESDVLGAYYSKTRTIVLNTSVLQNRNEAIESLLHECKHAHQHYLTDYLEDMNMLDNQAVKRSSYGRWQDEFDDYSNGEKSGFADYYNQDVEEDSRAYAYIWSKNYIMYIDRISGNAVNQTNMDKK